MHKGLIVATLGLVGLSGAGMSQDVFSPVMADAGASGRSFRSGDTPSSATGGAVDPIAVANLVGAINTALAGLSTGATEADIEAVLTYVVDQSAQPEDVRLAAIDQVIASGGLGNVRTALGRVRALNNRGAFGTGSIAGGEIALAAGPMTEFAGGSSDYAGR